MKLHVWYLRVLPRIKHQKRSPSLAKTPRARGGSGIPLEQIAPHRFPFSAFCICQQICSHAQSRSRHSYTFYLTNDISRPIGGGDGGTNSAQQPTGDRLENIPTISPNHSPFTFTIIIGSFLCVRAERAVAARFEFRF